MSHWQAKTAAAGVDDLVLLLKVTDSQIVDNLHKRYNNDLIYTYIGSVLIAVNPYKHLPYFTEKEIDQYHGSAAHENPPHIYALADSMFQNMLIDEESQCAIISGESGAGKTESSKLLMNYIAAVSGKGGSAVERVKHIILESNPLLEAFGNAKTLRNNNSSRFGKYFEIKFSRGGQPMCGSISNFLLEKSRVVSTKSGERNFHVFYQLCKGATRQEQEAFALAGPDYFDILRQSGVYDADGIDDVREFSDMKNAMSVCGVSSEEQRSIFSILAGILHLGNVRFREGGRSAEIVNEDCLDYPAYLFGVEKDQLKRKLLSRVVTTGGRGSITEMALNVQQAINTRDALSKALYSRLFDWIVASVNRAIHEVQSRDKLLSLGVLDIYGFEIFEKNGFEQLCINYVNEKLQQVFIELTLKSEQEEYVREGIRWTPIEYFNNKIVVELIEGKRPAGVMAVLDDVCVQLHAMTAGADDKFVEKLNSICANHPHYQSAGRYFSIKHYAGQVDYDCDGFCESNKDTLYRDLIQLAQSTSNPFIRSLFPEDIAVDDKKRPTTAGFKIRTQANNLVDTLMKCTPNYIRCIKPNEKKRPREWDAQRVEHQVRYLNLRENVNVRRAGFCYRNTFEKFLRRYCILSEQTHPNYRGPAREGVTMLLRSVDIESSQWQMGQTKVFIKSPESLFMLEELRERKYDGFARIIQRAYRRWRARKYYLECKKQALNLFVGQKERKRMSINREYIGDYLDIMSNPQLRSMAGKQEKVLFCAAVRKYDRRFNAQEWEVLITAHEFILVGWDKIKDGPHKGGMTKVIKRRLPLARISAVYVSTKCDDFFVLHIDGEYASVMECILKTELISVLYEAYKTLTSKLLRVIFNDIIEYSVKKTTWEGAGVRTLTFTDVQTLTAPKILKTSGKVTEIGVPFGLPKNTRPNESRPQGVNNRGNNNGGSRPAPSHSKQYQTTGRSRPPAPNQPPPSSIGKSPSMPEPLAMQQLGGLPPRSAAPPRPLAPPSNNNNNNNNYSNQSIRLPPSSNPSVRPPNSLPSGGTVRQQQFRPPVRPPPSQSVAQQPAMTVINPAFNPRPSFSQSTPDIAKAAGATNSGFGTLSAQKWGSVNALAAAQRTRPPPPAPKAAVAQCRALYDYHAREADEISMKVGDLVTIISKDNEGWWTGLCRGRRGLFPSNYVEEI